MLCYWLPFRLRFCVWCWKQGRQENMTEMEYNLRTLLGASLFFNTDDKHRKTMLIWRWLREKRPKKQQPHCKSSSTYVNFGNFSLQGGDSRRKKKKIIWHSFEKKWHAWFEWADAERMRLEWEKMKKKFSCCLSLVLIFRLQAEAKRKKLRSREEREENLINLYFIRRKVVRKRKKLDETNYSWLRSSRILVSSGQMLNKEILLKCVWKTFFEIKF